MIAAKSKWIARDPKIMGGEPVFAGTRVPVALLFEYLRDDGTIEEFLEDYPTVKRKAAEGVIAEVEAEFRAA